MAVPETQADIPPPAARRRFWPTRWRTRFAAGSAALALAAGGVVWFDRERLAADFIDQYLTEQGVPATFDIIAIGPRVQVIENLVVGDPARPDLTARRLVVELGVGWDGPQVQRVTVEGARAFGSYRDGTFSMGALDPLIFSGSDEPPALPAIDLVLRDARALIVSTFGDVGLTLDGKGRLDDGFAGTLAANAPGIGVDGCRADSATLYGQVTTTSGAPALNGPLRLAGLDCGGAMLAKADIGTELTLKRDFAGAEGTFAITGAGLAFDAYAGAGLTGTAQASWGASGLSLAHDLALADVTAPQGRLARLGAEGAWRGSADGARGQWEGQLRGTGLAPGAGLDAALAQAANGSQGTLIAPLLAKLRSAATRALTGASFTADALIRHKGADIALVIPEATLAARNGTRVLAASQVNAGLSAAGLTALRGNILAGGEGLPVINGRIEQTGSSGWALRMTMADYADGTNRLAIPRLTLRQESGGNLRFDGVLTASGALPGGEVRGLALPLEGAWSPARGLALGNRCTAIAFDALAMSGLALSGQTIRLCPEGGKPMLAYRSGLTLAARTGPLVLAGSLGESPARIAADNTLLRYPAPFMVEGLTAQIGAPGSAARLTAASLTGSLTGDVAGEFAGGRAQLDVVPLDLTDIAGRWSFYDGVLRVGEGSFTLIDRPEQGAARFKPLIARGASLQLADNVIRADAALRHPGSDGLITNIAITHDLDSATGKARLAVPGITFTKALQPEDLSELAKGVIALAEGTVTGTGRIDWTADNITSSGSFASKGIDFAAAFGPVRGLSGTVAFTDLLNLTTAPDQTVTIAALNPGIEVLDGTVQFEVRDGTLLSLEDARFPFMGGQLQMRPLDMDFSRPEERRYIFEIVGLDAATFVAEMELTNLSATGTFDGTLPIIFDANGNGRIADGLLIARPGGGNVAYIGDLTYEDLGAMGNYAFSALRSLDYRQMRVGLSGDLAGEIITNFDFDGVRQGEGASRNFITRRLAKLPIQFRINVRSETFSQLAIIARGYSDPTAWGNPFSMGLVRIEDGKLIMTQRNPPATPPTQPAPEPQSVQPAESDPLP